MKQLELDYSVSIEEDCLGQDFKNRALFDFKFVDLFAGIGGFHLAMHELGGKCVFASEIDPYARKTYIHNFHDILPKFFEEKHFNDDIRSVVPDEIPDFDLLCAGFPCQPFSQAGYKRGFNDFHKSERGNLFFNIVDIIQVKQPKAYFLENVRGLISHDKGKTFKLIRNILEQDLGYSFYYQIIKASDYGLPQLRPRAFIVGFHNESGFKSFTFPPKLPLKFTMSDVWGGVCSREIGFTLRVGGRGSPISDRRNWDSYLVNGEVKQLTYAEARKMQGFPDSFVFPVSATQAIKQLGNSVAVDAVKAVGKNVISYMNRLENKQKNLTLAIKKGNRTFSIPEFEVIQNALGLTVVKLGNSFQKSDIILDIENENIAKENEGFNIKSYVVKEDGNQVAFHIIDIESLKSYLFNKIKLDTPSTTRHRYGKLILENNGKLYFKLNLQLRF